LIALNPVDERVEYIGVRSCKCLPAEDLGYMSSSRTIAKMIAAGVTFNKEILATWPTRKRAVAHEVELHNAFDVARSPRFFNKAKQTCVGFDTEGTQVGDDNPMADPLVKAKHAAALAAEGYWARVSAGVRRAMQNPEVVARINKAKAEASRRPEVRAKLSVLSKIAMAKPEVKLIHSANTKAALLSPEINARLRAGHARRWNDGKQRELQSQRLKMAYKNNPEFALKVAHHGSDNGMFGCNHSAEAKAKMSAIRKNGAAQKRAYCLEKGIKPGSNYCNIDKVAFANWLAQQKETA
jgi:hypothetical protein